MIKNIIDNNKNVDVNVNKLNKLKELFPNCFNNNGEFDMSIFEEELKTNTSIVKEGYGLNFLGKNYAKYVSSLDTETILVPDEENNSKEENKNSENIYISGNNIDALKHLVKSYSGQIKCIYIDPPYNTGSDGFVYNDKFNLTVEKLTEVLDINEEEAKRIYSMTNNKSNSHSAWLTFMYPRLYITKQLLKEDGVIFISIDDNEQSQLKLLCDSIFGEENFVANFIRKTGSTRAMALNFDVRHDYVLIYAKSIEKIKLNEICKDVNGYVNFDDDKNGKWLSQDFSVRMGGYKYKIPSIDLTQYFERNWAKPIEETKKMMNASPSETFEEIYSRAKYDKITGWYTVGEFIFKGKDKIINKKKYADKTATLKNNTLYDNIGSNKGGTSIVKKLFNTDKEIFSMPKPVELIEYLEFITTNENDIILDFFSGSATTAHSIMKLNSKDNGRRKYIMVQLPELCDTKSEAYKNGYKTIDEIGQERIRRAAKKIKEETNADIDYGFKHYTIKDVNTNTLDKLEKFEPNYVVSDGSILDEFGINAVLTTWMNEDGYGLTDTYEKLVLEDYTAYKCQNTIYLLNWNISDLFIKTLIEKYEKEEKFDCNRIVMFGYSFTLNEIQTLKDNLQQVKNIKGINVEVITRY